MTPDVVVVGLGLIGAGALRHLAERGVDVVGVGPGEPAHWAGHHGVFASHYDSGRITRLLDARFEWAELAVRSIGEYPAIAEASEIEFHSPAGTVFASADQDHIARLDAVGRRVGAQHRVLGSSATGLPTTDDGRVLVADGRLALPAGSTVVAEPGPAGFIDPRRMLAAQLAAAQGHGATVIPGRRWSTSPAAARRGGSPPPTATRSPRPRCWWPPAPTPTSSGPLGGRFGGQVRPETVVIATLAPDEAERLAGIPSVLAHLTGTSFADLYQVPPTTYPDGTVGLKLGATLRDWAPLTTGAARRAWMAGTDHERWLPELRGLLEDLVPGVRAEAWTTKPCMITDTASGLPTVDHVAPGLVVAAGGNGYAAKSADAIGALAATLLQEGRWTDPVLDPEPFALA